MRWKEGIRIESPCKSCLGDCHSQHGCPKWQKWFIDYWNTYIHRDIPEKKNTKQVWHYEHPDYVREGIKWEG